MNPEHVIEDEGTSGLDTGWNRMQAMSMSVCWRSKSLRMTHAKSQKGKLIPAFYERITRGNPLLAGIRSGYGKNENTHPRLTRVADTIACRMVLTQQQWGGCSKPTHHEPTHSSMNGDELCLNQDAGTSRAEYQVAGSRTWAWRFSHSLSLRWTLPT